MKYWIWALVAGLLITPGLAQDKPGSAHKPEALGKAFAHKGSCPKDCKVCQTALTKAWTCLAKAQDGSGSWEAGNGGTVVVTSLAALALMASGDPQYQKNIDKAAQFILRTVAPGFKGKGKTASGQEFEGFGNWDLGYAALFLGEYYFQNPKTDTHDRIKFIIEKIKEQREPNGGWGHAPNFAYKDLIVVSTGCLAGLGSLKAAGFAIPEDVVADGVKYIESSSAGGTVGYSPREGQKGWGHAGRASGAAWAMWKLGAGGKFFERVSKFIKQGVKTVHQDHASPTLHYLWGGLYSYILGPEAWIEFKRNYLDLWLAMQTEDGRVLCPTDADVKASLGMDTDALVGPNYSTAVFALIFALPLDKTNLHKQKMAKKGATATSTGMGLGKKPTGKPLLGLRAKNFAGSIEVMNVVDKGPSAAAGLVEGDLIIEFKGRKLEKTADLRAELDKCSPGQKVSVVVLRGGERKTIDVKLGEAEKPKEDDVETEGAKKEPEEGELF